jgi:transposase
MSWGGGELLEERLHFIIDLEESSGSFKDLCEEYGITRKTGYKWVKRYEGSGFKGLEDLSRSPHRIPNRIANSLEERIIALRGEDGWGARKILHKKELIPFQLLRLTE